MGSVVTRVAALSLVVSMMACGGSGDSGGGTDKTDVDGGESGDGDLTRDGDGDGDGTGDGDGDGDAPVEVPIPEGCGNGMADPMAMTEACDDGNNIDGDGCARICTIELGYLCPPTGGACVPKCGDGLLFLGE